MVINSASPSTNKAWTYGGDRSRDLLWGGLLGTDSTGGKLWGVEGGGGGQEQGKNGSSLHGDDIDPAEVNDEYE